MPVMPLEVITIGESVAIFGLAPIGMAAADPGHPLEPVVQRIKASLKRLQLDHIDLYQIHGFDPATPIEETVRALDQLVHHGHVRYVGLELGRLADHSASPSGWACRVSSPCRPATPWPDATLSAGSRQIALAWLLPQPQVTSAIIGAKRPDQLADNLAAADVTLSTDELRALDEVSHLPTEYPGWMLERQGEARRKQLRDAQRS